jgi:hypothetical protein
MVVTLSKMIIPQVIRARVVSTLSTEHSALLAEYSPDLRVGGCASNRRQAPDLYHPISTASSSNYQ